MMRRFLVCAVVCAVVLAAAAVQAAPIFWVSEDALATSPSNIFTRIYPGATGKLNVFANTDVRLSGVSLDLVETGGFIRFTGAQLVNPNNRWPIPGLPTVSDSSVLSLSGGAIPNVVGGGIGPGSPDPGPGILFATVDYAAELHSGVSHLQLRVGDLVIADWEGNNPMVAFGEGPANIPGGVPGGAGPVGIILYIPEPATLSLIGLAIVGLLVLGRRWN
jgi:PEP-CTERM motif